MQVKKCWVQGAFAKNQLGQTYSKRGGPMPRKSCLDHMGFFHASQQFFSCTPNNIVNLKKYPSENGLSYDR